jgi:GRIM-19 protein
MSGPPKPPPRFARQDVAPPGGYAPITIDRNVPKSVTRGGAIALFVGGGLTMAFGLYRVGQFNIHRRYVPWQDYLQHGAGSTSECA